jgi:hypothetical protein
MVALSGPRLELEDHVLAFSTERKSVQESPQTRISEVVEQHALDM